MLSSKQITLTFSILTGVVIFSVVIYTLFINNTSTEPKVVKMDPHTSSVSASIEPSIAKPNVVDFSQLINKSNKPEQIQVLNNIYTDEYYIYPCVVDGVNEKVLMLVARSVERNGMMSIRPAQDAIQTYENDLYHDWGSIIFEKKFNPELQTMAFKEVPIQSDHILSNAYRVGTLSDNTTNIYYGWLLNYIVVAASEACLLKTMESVYDVH